MGKGYRNRDDRSLAGEILTKTAKTKKKKKIRGPMPKWIVPTIATVLVVCAVVGAVFGILSGNGVFKRNNVLVKSQVDGKYSVNQHAASILSWYSGWQQGLRAYWNALVSDGSTSNSSNQFVYCWSYASAARTNAHDVIEESADWFKELVALCDFGSKNGEVFTAEDEQTAYDNFIAEFKSQAKLYYSYFASGQGIENHVDSSTSPYFSAYLKDVFGSGLNSSDFRRAATIWNYANRVMAIQEAGYWNADPTTIDEEIAKNPDKYYSVGYLKYEADSEELAAALAAATDADAFKKLILADYVSDNYFAAYNQILADTTLNAVKDKDAETIAEALEAQGMTAADYANSEEAETGLTEAQKKWLFDADRAAFNATTVKEEDGSVTVIVLTEVTKDEAGKVTAVKAARKSFAATLNEEELAKVTNELCHHLDLPHDHEDLDETLEKLAENLKSGASAKLPTASSILYAKKTDVEKDVEELKKGLEEAEDKTSYLSQKNVPSSLGIGIDKKDEMDEAIAAFVFGEDTKAGDIKVISTNDGRTRHLIYISEITTGTTEETETSEETATTATAPSATSAPLDEPILLTTSNGEGSGETETGEGDDVMTITGEGGEEGEDIATAETTDTKKVSYYDYSVSIYESAFEQWLFQDVNEETMEGGKAVGTVYLSEKTVYYVTRALDLGEDVIRGGYASFEGIDAARAAKETLSGLTGGKLLVKLSDVDASSITTTTNGTSIKESSLSSADLKAWLFSDERKTGDYDVIYNEDEDGNILSGIYLAVYLGRVPSGEFDARTNYADEAGEEWIHNYVAENGYEMSASALAKIKNLKVEDTTAEE